MVTNMKAHSHTKKGSLQFLIAVTKSLELIRKGRQDFVETHEDLAISTSIETHIFIESKMKNIFCC